MSTRSDSLARPPGRRCATGFFLLMAATPVIPYIKVSSVGLALNDFPPILAVALGGFAVLAQLFAGRSVRVPAVALITGEIILVAAASTLVHGLDSLDVLAGPIRWTEITLLVALAFILGADKGLRSLFLRTVTILGAADAVFGIGAFVVGYAGPYYIGIEPFRSYQTLHSTFPGRISGTLGLPATGAGALFALLLPIALGYAIGARDRQMRIRWAFAAMSLAVGLLFTFDRVSIALGIGLVVVLLGLRLRPQIALSAAALSLLLIVASPLRNRFTDSNDRLALWSAALKMIRANPLLGVGPAQYLHRLPEYQKTSFGLATATAHNSVLEAGATLGVAAAVLLVVAVAVSLGWLPAALRERVRSPELLGAWLGLLGFTLGSLTINYFFTPQLGLLFWTLALALSRSAPASPAGDDPTGIPPAVPAPRVPTAVRRAVAAGRTPP
ncbi:MAG: O-antigen ligase family protein [Actinomycetota bacterium]|nr:O-antigen ligase family protein [Actinomycetota bacterium]